METVILRSFYNSIPAQITAAKLEEAGIPAHIVGEGAVSMLSISNPPNGGIQLLVAKTDEQKAKQLLYEFDEAYKKAAVCVVCGSNDFIMHQPEHVSGTFMAVIGRILTGKSGQSDEYYECVKCGKKTKELPDPPENYYTKDLL